MDVDEIRDLQYHVDTRNAEAKAAVEAFLDAAPGRDLKLAAPLKVALDLADEANETLRRTLRRALDTRKPAGVPA